MSTRAVDPALAEALAQVLQRRHVGRDQAATWERLAAELEEAGVRVSNVRRLQEAASWLRRVQKLAIGSASHAGVYLVADDADRKIAAAERLKRIRTEAEELAAFDRSVAEKVQRALDLEAA